MAPAKEFHSSYLCCCQLIIVRDCWQILSILFIHEDSWTGRVMGVCSLLLAIIALYVVQVYWTVFDTNNNDK